MPDVPGFPASLGDLNTALDQRIKSLIGDGIIGVDRGANGAATVKLNVDVLASRLPKLLVLAQLTGSASRPGVYNGKLWKYTQHPIDVSSGSVLAVADFGVFGDDSGGNNCYLVNVRELGKNTHDCASSSFLPTIFLGFAIGLSSDDLPVIAFDGGQQEDCT